MLNRYVPCAFVTLVTGPPGSAGDATVTVTPGTTARVSSLTTPVMVPVTTCAPTARAQKHIATTTDEISHCLTSGLPHVPMERRHITVQPAHLPRNVLARSCPSPLFRVTTARIRGAAHDLRLGFASWPV